MTIQKFTFPPARERPLQIHPRYYPDAAWTTLRTVRFGACDATGVLSTSGFTTMVGGVIEDFLIQGLKTDYHTLVQKDGIGLGTKSMDSDFFRPATMGDRLSFTVLVEHVGRTSMVFSLHGVRETTEIVRCHLVMVTTALNTHNAIAIPAALKEALVAYQESCR